MTDNNNLVNMDHGGGNARNAAPVGTESASATEDRRLAPRNSNLPIVPCNSPMNDDMPAHVEIHLPFSSFAGSEGHDSEMVDGNTNGAHGEWITDVDAYYEGQEGNLGLRGALQKALDGAVEASELPLDPELADEVR